MTVFSSHNCSAFFYRQGNSLFYNNDENKEVGVEIAKYLRLSPDKRYVIIPTKNKETKYAVRRLKLDGSLGCFHHFTLPSRAHLEGIHFISNEYFAVPE